MVLTGIRHREHNSGQSDWLGWGRSKVISLVSFMTFHFRNFFMEENKNGRRLDFYLYLDRQIYQIPLKRLTGKM